MVSKGNNKNLVARDTLKSWPDTETWKDKESEEKERDIKKVTSHCIPTLWQY